MTTTAPTSQIKLFIISLLRSVGLPAAGWRYWMTCTTVRVCGSTMTRWSLTTVYE